MSIINFKNEKNIDSGKEEVAGESTGKRRKSSLFLRLKNFRSLQSLNIPKLFNLRKLLRKENSEPILKMSERNKTSKMSVVKYLELGKGWFSQQAFKRRPEDIQAILQPQFVSIYWPYFTRSSVL